MRRGRLPLTALRSFEVAGRLRSFTLAAQELFISQAAISRQIRELETALGRALFERRHRSVRLTPAGEALLAVLTPSFDAMGDCLDDLQAQAADDRSVVTISAEPSFAACWLMPRLSEFQKENPTIDVNVDADPRLAEFRVHGTSLAIRHSLTASAWPRVESRYLTHSRISPAMSSALIERDGRPSAPSDLLRYPLLHEDRRNTWRQWFEAAGLPGVETGQGLVYTDEGLILQAALRGQGVALIEERFVDEDVRAGRLIRPFDTSIPFGAYWIVARRFDRLPAPAALLADWIERSFRKDDRQTGP
ncbi:LysR family transcriptional regulator, glycine cleavage system transcriptional activator [Rhizobium sp. NFR07]|uniref:LysR substrate-binding domain-containing protein n=1 Tax=Rhizobium sp. NFR07 TaxID=1566262 RepID=UPI0008E63A63|nr:LysR substrate-binding domain-containing protein [Rhizobium sp. NFR07]SFA89558.1 LysR family transcriptional regulator, glycine cleavage system transcriptional activator [Rhizobium sp. NFR07]